MSAPALLLKGKLTFSQPTENDATDPKLTLAMS